MYKQCKTLYLVITSSYTNTLSKCSNVRRNADMHDKKKVDGGWNNGFMNEYCYKDTKKNAKKAWEGSKTSTNVVWECHELVYDSKSAAKVTQDDDKR